MLELAYQSFSLMCNFGVKSVGNQVVDIQDRTLQIASITGSDAFPGPMPTTLKPSIQNVLLVTLYPELLTVHTTL